MVSDRQKRDPITVKRRLQGALIAGLWVAVPTSITGRVHSVIAGKIPEDPLLSIALMLGVSLADAALMAIIFLPIGWLVERNLASKGTWQGYSFVLAGIGMVLFFPALELLMLGAINEYWFLGFTVIFGAHAGWRYYSWLSADRVIVI